MWYPLCMFIYAWNFSGQIHNNSDCLGYWIYITNHSKTVVWNSYHFLRLVDPVDEEFQWGTLGMAYLYSPMSRASVGKTSVFSGWEWLKWLQAGIIWRLFTDISGTQAEMIQRLDSAGIVSWKASRWVPSSCDLASSQHGGLQTVRCLAWEIRAPRVSVAAAQGGSCTVSDDPVWGHIESQQLYATGQSSRKFALIKGEETKSLAGLCQCHIAYDTLDGTSVKEF